MVRLVQLGLILDPLPILMVLPDASSNKVLKIKFKYVRQQPLSRNSSRLNNYTQSIIKFANLVALKSPKQALQRLCQIINNEDQLRKSNFRDVDP